MNRRLIFTTACSLFVCGSISAPTTLADAKSDYDYQYGQYRQNYIEYTVLKKDYLNNPSLDNQQKATLAAKQSIITRELAKASLAWYLGDLIHSSNVNYELVKPILSSLEVARSFFLTEAQKSQGLVTPENLKTYTDSYIDATIPHDQSFKYGIIVNKIVKLVRIQTDCKLAFDDLLPKLPSPTPTLVGTRMSELQEMAKGINSKIDTLANSLNPALGEENVDSEIFFTARIEKLNEIRALQLDWINRLIDIDINYVQNKI